MKYCIAEYQNFFQNSGLFDSKSISEQKLRTEVMNFAGKTQKWNTDLILRQESDSSSAGVVQLKLKERKEGGMWERRGGREGGKSLTSLCSSLNTEQ